MPRAIFSITNEFLEGVLKLPSSSSVICVATRALDSDTINILVEDAVFPEPRDSKLPIVEPVYDYGAEGETIFLKWEIE